MPKQEEQTKVNLGVGDKFIVEGEKSQVFEVEKVGKKKTVARVGNVRLAETKYTLKPIQKENEQKTTD